MSPFQDIHDRLKAVNRQLLQTELAALKSLPSVPWNFRFLRRHIWQMAKFVKKELPLKAWKLHEEALMPPAVRLGRKRSWRKRAAAYNAALKGAAVRSDEKRRASRENLVKAREARIAKMRAWESPEKIAKKIAKLKHKLKWNFNRREKELGRPEAQRNAKKIKGFTDRMWKLNVLLKDIDSKAEAGVQIFL